MLRHAFSAALLTAVTAAATLVVASPAHADGTCHLSVPTRISIKHTRTVVYGTVSGSCRQRDGYGTWDMWRNGGDPSRDTYVFYDQSEGLGSRVMIDLYDFSLQWGRNTYHPDGASDGCNDYTAYSCSASQNTPTSDIRLSSASGMAGKRVKTVVTLTGGSSVYSPNADRYVRHPARGQFQWRARGGAWHGLRNVTTSRTGVSTMKVRAVTGRQYRFVTSTAANWWSSGSRVVAP